MELVDEDQWEKDEEQEEKDKKIMNLITNHYEEVEEYVEGLADEED